MRVIALERGNVKWSLQTTQSSRQVPRNTSPRAEFLRFDAPRRRLRRIFGRRSHIDRPAPPVYRSAKWHEVTPPAARPASGVLVRPVHDASSTHRSRASVCPLRRCRGTTALALQPRPVCEWAHICARMRFDLTERSSSVPPQGPSGGRGRTSSTGANA